MKTKLILIISTLMFLTGCGMMVSQNIQAASNSQFKFECVGSSNFCTDYRDAENRCSLSTIYRGYRNIQKLHYVPKI